MNNKNLGPDNEKDLLRDEDGALRRKFQSTGIGKQIKIQ